MLTRGFHKMMQHQHSSLRGHRSCRSQCAARNVYICKGGSAFLAMPVKTQDRFTYICFSWMRVVKHSPAHQTSVHTTEDALVLHACCRSDESWSVQARCTDLPAAGPVNAASETLLQPGQCLLIVSGTFLHFSAERDDMAQSHDVWLHGVYLWAPDDDASAPATDTSEAGANAQLVWRTYDMARVLWLTGMSFHGGAAAVGATSNILASGVHRA